MTFDKTPTNQTVIDPLDLSVSDVTGYRTVDLEGIDGHRSVADVALSVAEVLSLPGDIPYGLRDSLSARMLVDDESIGSQIGQNSELAAIPKSHLGVGRLSGEALSRDERFDSQTEVMAVTL